MQKILIIEDDNILSKAINTALIDAKFTTEVAKDGEEGLRKTKEFKPDLILLDLIMPKKTGEEVLAELKNDEETRHIPVIVTTVKSEYEVIDKCKSLGASSYLIKAQYTLDEIVEQIRRTLV